MRFGRVLLACALGAVLPAGVVDGCASTDTTTTNTGPTGTPVIKIASPKNGDCFAFPPDTPDPVVPVVYSVSAFDLRPPGACGAEIQCGYVVLRVNGVDNNQSATGEVDVLL